MKHTENASDVCRANCATLNFDLTHVVGHGFLWLHLEIAVSQEREDRLTWEEGDVCRQDIGSAMGP